MKLRSFWFGAALLFIAMIAIVARHQGPQSHPANAKPSANPSPTPGSKDSNSDRRSSEFLATGTAAQLRAGELDPELIALKETLRDFRAQVGENPIGNNTEITKALLGANTRGANFKTAEMKIKDGKIVDRWGHPYFFHQLSRTEMEIRCAGPDGIMWTPDDEVLR